MWTSDGTTFYDGDCRAGDRAATPEELAGYAFVRARAAKAQAIGAAYMAALLQGVPYGGTALQIRDEDRPNVVAVFARAVSNVLFGLMEAADPQADLPEVQWPEGGHPFRMLDNSTLFFTQAEFIALAVKAADRFTAIRLNAGALRDALAAAQTMQEIEAIDPSNGWET